MKESGWDIKVRNVVFMYLMTHKPPPHPITPPETLKEPMSFIRNAQVSGANENMSLQVKHLEDLPQLHSKVLVSNG